MDVKESIIDLIMKKVQRSMTIYAMLAAYPLPVARPYQMHTSQDLGLPWETRIVAHLSAMQASPSPDHHVFLPLHRAQLLEYDQSGPSTLTHFLWH